MLLHDGTESGERPLVRFEEGEDVGCDEVRQ